MCLRTTAPFLASTNPLSLALRADLQLQHVVASWSEAQHDGVRAAQGPVATRTHRLSRLLTDRAHHRGVRPSRVELRELPPDWMFSSLARNHLLSSS